MVFQRIVVKRGKDWVVVFHRIEVKRGKDWVAVTG